MCYNKIHVQTEKRTEGIPTLKQWRVMKTSERNSEKNTERERESD